MSGMTRTRRVLNLVVALAFAGALAVPMLTHDAPVGGWVGSESEIMSMPAWQPNIPAWHAGYAKRFPGCVERTAAVPAELLVVDGDAHVVRVAFDKAWGATHNEEWADDVWVVGSCR